MNRRSAGSIFWGVILVAIGGLLLAHNLGYSVPIWSGLAVYWPVLVIAWGLVKLVDYYRLSRTGNQHLFSPGEVALLIIVIFAGSAFTAAANFSPGFAEFLNFPADFDLWDITGNNYEYYERHDVEAAPGSVIEITNLYGSVDVQPSDANMIMLDVKKTVRAANQQEADSRVGEFTFSIRNQDGRIRIISSRDEDTSSRRDGRQRFKSSLTLRVPKSASMQVNNRNGAVQVSDLTGDQNISNRYGQVTLRGIEGSVTVENRYASVIVERVSAGAGITNRYGSVTAREVGGPVKIENRYGSVDVRDVKGNAAIDNSYSAISVANIEGQLQIAGRNNSVDVEGIVGALVAETSYRGMNVRRAQDRIDARNLHGDITIAFDRPPQHPVSISSEYGDVVLNMPSDAAFTIEARTRSGELTSDFEQLPGVSSGRERTVNGSVGAGGPQIRIETRNGNIRIQKRG